MDELRAQNATLQAENARLAEQLAFVKQRANAQMKALYAENVRLKHELQNLKEQPMMSVPALPPPPSSGLEPLLELLRRAAEDGPPPAVVKQPTTGKLCADARFFEFGQIDEFLGGLGGLLSRSGLTRSIAEECHENDEGAWAGEYEYVALQAAEEDVELPTTAKFKGQHSSSGLPIVRDAGHAGMTLDSFCEAPEAVAAGLTGAETAALRLYSGPLYGPLNAALRSRKVEPWATTIACCYSGVLKLSAHTRPARVYRGVNEEHLKLPERFFCGDGAATDGSAGFAGGIERAFMSTTKSEQVALDYSGGAASEGSIFAISFNAASRGASIQFLSQYPHEEELLFPPCTGLACHATLAAGRKRVLTITAQVSTACPDVRDITTPEHVPGTADALRWTASAFGCLPEALAFLESVDLSGQNIEAFGHHLVMLLGRATHEVPRLLRLRLYRCQLRTESAVQICGALHANTTLERLALGGNAFGHAHGGAEVAAAVASMLGANRTLHALDLRTNNICSTSVVVIAKALADTNRALRELILSGNAVDAHGAEALGAAIGACTSLCCLKLSNSGMDDTARARLLKAKKMRSGGAHHFELVY